MVLSYTRLFVKPEYHHVIYQQLGALQLWTPPEEKVSGGESPCPPERDLADGLCGAAAGTS